MRKFSGVKIEGGVACVVCAGAGGGGEAVREKSDGRWREVVGGFGEGGRGEEEKVWIVAAEDESEDGRRMRWWSGFSWEGESARIKARTERDLVGLANEAERMVAFV